MKLTIIERIALLGLLPAENNFVTLKIIRKLKEDLSFSEDEIKQFEIKAENDRMFWNVKVENNLMPDGKEIAIGEKASDIIVEALKKLDESKKLAERHVSLYEKFVAAG